MKTDRELLELAARAAGIEAEWCGIYEPKFIAGRNEWNPLTDDGDALRLAVKLRLDVEFHHAIGDRDEGVSAINYHLAADGNDGAGEIVGVACGEIGSATRRAIVRAAAIGEGME